MKATCGKWSSKIIKSDAEAALKHSEPSPEIFNNNPLP